MSWFFDCCSRCSYSSDWLWCFQTRRLIPISEVLLTNKRMWTRFFLRDSEKFVPELRENGTLPTALSGTLIRPRYRGSHRSRPSDPCLMDSKVANSESVRGNSANRFDKSKVYILDGDVSLALGIRLGFQDTTRDKCWPASALKVSITSIVCTFANVFLIG